MFTSFWYFCWFFIHIHTVFVFRGMMVMGYAYISVLITDCDWIVVVIVRTAQFYKILFVIHSWWSVFSVTVIMGLLIIIWRICRWRFLRVRASSVRAIFRCTGRDTATSTCGATATPIIVMRGWQRLKFWWAFCRQEFHFFVYKRVCHEFGQLFHFKI